MDLPQAARLGRLAGLAGAGVVVLVGCDRGCASPRADWQVLAERSAGSPPNPGTTPGPGGGGRSWVRGTDCPDGLARCEDGRVWVSRLATLTAACGGASAPCVCPWDSIAACRGSCAAEGAVAVMDREKAAVQMCAPAGRAGESRPLGATPFVRALSPDTQPPSDCDDDDAYRCSDSVVVDCALRRGVGRCSNGCSGPGATLFGDGFDRESAFAILCSR